MQKHIKIITFWIISVIYLLSIAGAPALAATTPPSSATSTADNGQALEIAPPLVYLTVNPGQTTTTQIYIRDISSGDLVVTGQADDFIANGENGTPKLLLTPSEDKNDPYSLKNWMTIPQSLLLIPNEIKVMTIGIAVPLNASPGGHYGVVRFSAVPPSLQGTGVSLSASLGALFLVTVNGNIKERLSILSFSVNKAGKTGSVFQSGPINFVEVINNTGNEHLQPIGQITINDMFGRILAKQNVNLPPGNILPGSERKFTQALDSSIIGNKILFGRYSAKLKVTYGTPTQVITSSLVFWIIPYKLIAIVIAALIVGFFILRYLLRRYNKYILKQADKYRQQKPPNK